MQKDHEIEISLEDVKLIMGDRFRPRFKMITESVFCTHCQGSYSSKINIKKIWLNRLGDIILEGSCHKCKNPVGRYLETGEDPESFEQAMVIRELKIEVLEDFKGRE